MLRVALGALADMLFLVPDDFSDVGRITQDLSHAGAGELRGAVGRSSQGVDMAGHGDTAVAFGVELKHHSDKPGLRLIDLQGGLAVHHSFVIAVWGVGHIAPVLDRHLEAAAQAFGDDLVLSAADEGTPRRSHRPGYKSFPG